MKNKIVYILIICMFVFSGCGIKKNTNKKDEDIKKIEETKPLKKVPIDKVFEKKIINNFEFSYQYFSSTEENVQNSVIDGVIINVCSVRNQYIKAIRIITKDINNSQSYLTWDIDKTLESEECISTNISYNENIVSIDYQFSNKK